MGLERSVVVRGIWQLLGPLDALPRGRSHLPRSPEVDGAWRIVVSHAHDGCAGVINLLWESIEVAVRQEARDVGTPVLTGWQRLREEVRGYLVDVRDRVELLEVVLPAGGPGLGPVALAQHVDPVEGGRAPR